MTSAMILVVEDNPVTSKMLRVALQAEGFTVIEAQDGRTAVANARQTLPDLVLQDLVLPDMDGFELLRQLRALRGGLELPILALTGFISRLEEARTAEAGFTAMLVKPIEPSRLIDAVRAYLPDTPPARGADARGAGRRLLIVDDDPVQLKLTRLQFAAIGFDVTTAGRGMDALSLARAAAPDVILSDVYMPDMDGFQLCLELRRDPALAKVPVVLISAQGDSESHRDLARRVGANALVLRTPDAANALPAILEATTNGAQAIADQPSDALKLERALLVIQQLERQLAATNGLVQRCALQAAQLSLLSGVADALRHRTDLDVVLRDVLAATLDAAGISKGALFLRDEDTSVWRLRQHVGFSAREREQLEDLFTSVPFLEELVGRGAALSLPSPNVDAAGAQSLLSKAGATSAHVVPLVTDGRALGALLIAATHTDITSEDAVVFARAMGNQLVQSLALARSVARLTASEQRYRTLLDQASDAIAILTPDGIVREVNHRWGAIVGVPRAELVGRPIAELAPLASDLANPDAKVTRADGTTVLLAISSTPVDIMGERLVFTVGRDVTEQRRLEQQLRQVQKMEAVGQLAGGIAHDFNNVLTAILGFCEILLGDPRTTNREEVVQIQTAGQRAASLTRQLLAFSRQQILQPKIHEVNDLVSRLEPMLRRLILEHIQLVVSLTSEPTSIKIDDTQFEQVLVNLVVNARDAMPRGGMLTIETLCVRNPDPTLPPGAYVAVNVRDTGMGMDEATKRRIFEPFFTTKGVGKGTGLGLSTVYGIVTQSHGVITVSTKLREGTTFTVYFPRVAAPAQTASTTETSPEQESRGVETVLVVEDDRAVRWLASTALRRKGYHVIEAGDPAEAVRVAREYAKPIHLLLSDVIMPESEPTPLIERLSALQATRPRVLYMSGYGYETILSQNEVDNETPFLQKPFTPRALAQKVRDVLDGAPSA